MSIAPALADPTAVAYLRKADPVMARLIDARPDFRPRVDELRHHRVGLAKKRDRGGVGQRCGNAHG